MRHLRFGYTGKPRHGLSRYLIIGLMSVFWTLSSCQADKKENGSGIGLTAAQNEGAPASTETAPPEETPTEESVPTATVTSIGVAESPEPASPTQTLVVETPTATATSPPPENPVLTINLVPVASGFERPTYLTHANDSRLFVVEQAGLIWIVESGQKSPEPFLDITDRVSSLEFERGLFSLAFHPEYHENRSFFVNYTNREGNVVVSRFQGHSNNPSSTLLDSEEVLLVINQPYANHNGGQLQFGPDGLLYIGLGDGGSAGDPQNHGQNPATLLGTILRIDVDAERGYAVPADNPFTNTDAVPGEIWAYGLRNPWRFSFDRQTGDLYLSDVGQSNWEEINFQPAGSSGGQNYGWNVTEGFNCYNANLCDRSGLTEPVHEYSHIEGGCSVTGGYVYRGERYPELNGNYFFGDYCSGFIWSLLENEDGEWTSNLVLQSGINISSFGEDINGEIYILDHTNGRIDQIQP